MSSTIGLLLILLCTITEHVTADSSQCCATIGTPNCDKEINARLHSLLQTRATRCIGSKWGENLALRKNATQSSYYQPAISSSVVVDGNSYSDYGGGSCICTAVLDNEQAWWAVDLGKETTIGRVRITNRNVGANGDLFIGLTNVSPWTCPPLMNQSSICKYYPGYLPLGAPTDIFCEPTVGAGRYLFVQLAASKNTPLNICELEAYCY